MLNSKLTKGAVALCLISAISVSALEITNEAWEKIQKRLDDRDAQLAATKIEGSPVDVALDSKYGPNANVTTKQGKLQIGGLLQVWYYNIQRDSRGFFDDPAINGIVDDNSTSDNSSFRIRRSEIRLYMDINENISTYLMIDPAREALGFPQFPSNQGNIKRANNVSSQFLAIAKPLGVNSTSTVTAAQNGASSTSAPRLLQDAYINLHDVVPHHDFQIGQWCARLGEEAVRDNGKLDFVERSMLGSLGTDMRDMGAMVHGSWWGTDCNDRDGRFQYWGGVFDGAASYFDVGNNQNRPDNNNQKDINLRLLLRPIWNDCWGHWEVGGSFMGGRHGEGHNDQPIAAPYPGLDRPINWAVRYNVWSYSRYAGFLSGLWTRSEYTFIKDRENPGTVLDATGNGTGPNPFVQQLGQAFSRQGYYSAIGYNFADSKICNLPCWLKPVEILGRYDRLQNIDVANVITPYKTDRFYTSVYTAGINYYISGHNAKVQANYNFVDLSDAVGHQGPNRSFHNVNNDSFVINFQVAF